MAIDITDNTNYYRWSTGNNNLNLNYQNGGNNNMTSILSVSNDGSILSNSLKKTSNASDTTDPVFIMADQNGKLTRAYGTYTSMNNTITGLQNKVNDIDLSVTHLIEMTNNLSNQTSGALSVINGYVQKNIDYQVASLNTLVNAQQATIQSIQTSVDRIGNLTGTTGIRSNERLFMYIIVMAALLFITFVLSIVK